MGNPGFPLGWKRPYSKRSVSNVLLLILLKKSYYVSIRVSLSWIYWNLFVNTPIFFQNYDYWNVSPSLQSYPQKPHHPCVLEINGFHGIKLRKKSIVNKGNKFFPPLSHKMSAFGNDIISHNKRVYNKLEMSLLHINLIVNTPVLLVLSVLLPIFNINRRKDSVKRCLISERTCLL